MCHADPRYSAIQRCQEYCDKMNEATKEQYADCECHYEPPYGLVIEAGCPKHD